MSEKEDKRLGLKRANYLCLIASIILLTLGFIIMGLNDITISPILMTIAYVIVIPLSLLWRSSKRDDQ